MIQILHLDDEPALLDLAQDFLESRNDRFTVLTETEPSAALDRLETEEIHCIVSDYEMPEMDGIEVLEAVREKHPDLPFILFTGKGSEEIASEAVTAGATDYIRKGSGHDRYALLANRIEKAVDRHRARRQTELLEGALDTADEGISLVDPDGTFSYVNSTFASLFGYDPDELVGEDWTVLYPDETATRLERNILPDVRDTGHWSGETVRVTADGDRLVTGHRLAHTGRDVIVCTASDVTGERSNLGDRSSPYDVLLDAMADYAFYTLDHEGYVTRWNDGARALLGYTADEILGEHLSIFFTEEDRSSGRPEELLEAARAEGSVTDEGWRRRADGERFWSAVRIAACYDNEGTIRGFGEVTKQTTAPERPTDGDEPSGNQRGRETATPPPTKTGS